MATEPLVLQSNTGQNDKQGSWWSGLLQTAEKGVETYRQFTARPTSPAPSTPVAAGQAPINYTPWLIGGGVVVALIVVVVLVKR